MPTHDDNRPDVEPSPEGFLDLALRISTVPRSVMGRNAMVSMFVTSFALGVAIPEAAHEWAPTIGLPLFLILVAFLSMAWLGDGGGQEGGWWEAICHPWRRADRLDAQRKAEREALERAEHEQSKSDTAYEQERRMKLIELTDPERWSRIQCDGRSEPDSD